MPTKEEIREELLRQQRPSDSVESEPKRLDPEVIEALRRSYMGPPGSMGGPEPTPTPSRSPQSDEMFSLDPAVLQSRDQMLSRTSPEAPYEPSPEVMAILEALSSGEMPEAQMAPVSIEDDLGEQVKGDEYESPGQLFTPRDMPDVQAKEAELEIPYDEEGSRDMEVQGMEYEDQVKGQDASYDALEKIRDEQEMDLMRRIKELR